MLGKCLNTGGRLLSFLMLFDGKQTEENHGITAAGISFEGIKLRTFPLPASIKSQLNLIGCSVGFTIVY